MTHAIQRCVCVCVCVSVRVRASKQTYHLVYTHSSLRPTWCHEGYH